MTEKKYIGRFIIIFFCLVIGLAASIYSLDLFLLVQKHGPNVDSFCAISETINCVTVETSEYAVVLGVPIALYGLEYYAVALAVLLLSFTGVWSLRQWQSYLFWLAAISVPVITVLAYLAFAVIGSICIVCCSVYLVNLTMLICLLLANRGHRRELAAAGPREFFGVVRAHRGWQAGAAVFAVVALSQFFWVSPLLGIEAGGGRFAFQGLPARGLTLGNPNAPIQIEEFTDFQCPFCGKAHNVMLQLVGRYPDKIRLTHRDYPLDQECNPHINRPFHPDACRAALYARCAAKENRFWQLDEAMFRYNKYLQKENIAAYASEAGLKMKTLDECVADPKTRAEILGDINEGHDRGVTATPTFFVNGELIVGFRPIEFWEAKIQELLARPAGR